MIISYNMQENDCAKIKMLKGYKVMHSEGRLWGVRNGEVILRWERRSRGWRKGRNKIF